jgi:ubiquinone/menaquinone biosynthesis C-methylase UbiE
MDFLDRTRDGYDAAATEFAALFDDYLDDKPIEKALLVAFAELVRATGNTSVADVGCGTGVTTRILADLGVQPTGIDLSPNMIAEARARAPELRFEVGSMTSLELPDASVGGVCAWYSTIHVPDSHLPQTLSQFHRVLVDGGVALLAFQVGNRPRRLTEAFGRPLDLEFIRREPGAVAATLEAAGLPVYSTTVREPDDDGVQTTPQAFLVARKRSAR